MNASAVPPTAMIVKRGGWDATATMLGVSWDELGFPELRGTEAGSRSWFAAVGGFVGCLSYTADDGQLAHEDDFAANGGWTLTVAGGKLLGIMYPASSLPMRPETLARATPGQGATIWIAADLDRISSSAKTKGGLLGKKIEKIQVRCDGWEALFGIVAESGAASAPLSLVRAIRGGETSLLGALVG
jgi:hypothetical protein